MKIVYNNILPVKEFTVMNLFGVIFALKAYDNISFEKEAYTYQYDYSYLKKRKKISLD